MEGRVFECPWTGRKLNSQNYDLDHLLPLSAYPINELWNLVPADAIFNRNKKRDRLPAALTLEVARPRLMIAYENYLTSESMGKILHQDALMRFNGRISNSDLSGSLANCAMQFITIVAKSRNLASF